MIYLCSNTKGLKINRSNNQWNRWTTSCELSVRCFLLVTGEAPSLISISMSMALPQDWLAWSLSMETFTYCSVWRLLWLLWWMKRIWPQIKFNSIVMFESRIDWIECLQIFNSQTNGFSLWNYRSLIGPKLSNRKEFRKTFGQFLKIVEPKDRWRKSNALMAYALRNCGDQ